MTIEEPTQRASIVLALVAGLIAAAHVGKLPPALPAIRAELGLDLVTAGWLASMFSATGMITAVFLGAAADSEPPVIEPVGGLALMAISCAASRARLPQAPLIAISASPPTASRR